MRAQLLLRKPYSSIPILEFEFHEKLRATPDGTESSMQYILLLPGVSGWRDAEFLISSVLRVSADFITTALAIDEWNHHRKFPQEINRIGFKRNFALVKLR